MTAVEFIKEELNRLGLLDKGQVMTNIFEQAKQMEKQQMQDFGARCCLMTKQKNEWSLEQLYNETYGSKGSDGNFKQFSLYEHKETITSSDIKKSETMGLYDKIELVNPNDSIFKSSQTEISDEEVDKEANNLFAGDLMWSERIAFKVAIKWYKEQLKQRQ